MKNRNPDGKLFERIRLSFDETFFMKFRYLSMEEFELKKLKYSSPFLQLLKNNDKSSCLKDYLHSKILVQNASGFNSSSIYEQFVFFSIFVLRGREIKILFEVKDIESHFVFSSFLKEKFLFNMTKEDKEYLLCFVQKKIIESIL